MNQMTLVAPVAVPEQYRETVESVVAKLYHTLKWTAEQQFGFYDLPVRVAPLQVMLAEPLAQIARAAAGETPRTEEAEGELVECVQTVMELCFSSPFLSTYHIPDAFWETDLGAMVARAQLWLREDELITITAAAHLAGISVPAVSQAVDAERLRAYHNPDAPQRQGARLVSRAEVLALWPTE